MASVSATLFESQGELRAVMGCSDIYGGELRAWLAVWDAASGEELYRLDDFETSIWHLAVSPDGQQAISSSFFGELVLWNLETAALVRQFDTEASFITIDLSRDGTRALATSNVYDPSTDSFSSSLVLWDVQMGTVADQIPLDFAPSDVALGPGESSAIVTTQDARLIKLDLATRQVLWQSYLGVEAAVVSVSPDGRYILTRETNIGTLSLWDVESGALVQRLGDHHGGLPNVVFAPDSHSFFSVGLDGAIIEWGVAAWSLDDLRAWAQHYRYVRDFTCRERAQYHIEPLCK